MPATMTPEQFAAPKPRTMTPKEFTAPKVMTPEEFAAPTPQVQDAGFQGTSYRSGVTTKEAGAPGTPGILGVTAKPMVHGAAGTGEALARGAEREIKTWHQRIWPILAYPAEKLRTLVRGQPTPSIAEARETVKQSPMMTEPGPYSDLGDVLGRFQEEHPDWAPRQIESAGQLLSDPNALLSNLSAMIPYMAATTGAFLAAGPGAAGLVAYGVESQGAYENAIASGASEEDAQTAAAITGSVNAVIELAQVGAWVKFGKKTAKAMLIRNAARRAIAKTTAGQAAILAVREGVEEVLQGTTEDVTAWAVYDKPFEDFWKNRQVEAVLGGLGGLVMGGGGVAVSVGAAKVQAQMQTVADLGTPTAPAVVPAEPVPVQPEDIPPAEPVPVRPEDISPAAPTPTEGLPAEAEGKIGTVKPSRTIAQQQAFANKIKRVLKRVVLLEPSQVTTQEQLAKQFEKMPSRQFGPLAKVIRKLPPWLSWQKVDVVTTKSRIPGFKKPLLERDRARIEIDLATGNDAEGAIHEFGHHIYSAMPDKFRAEFKKATSHILLSDFVKWPEGKALADGIEGGIGSDAVEQELFASSFVVWAGKQLGIPTDTMFATGEAAELVDQILSSPTEVTVKAKGQAIRSDVESILAAASDIESFNAKTLDALAELKDGIPTDLPTDVQSAMERAINARMAIARLQSQGVPRERLNQAWLQNEAKLAQELRLIRNKAAGLAQQPPAQPTVPKKRTIVPEKVTQPAEGKQQVAPFAPDPTAETPYPAKKGGFIGLPGKGKPTTGAPKPWLDMDKAASPDKQVQSFFGRTNRLVKPSAKLRKAGKKVRLWFRERFVFAPKVPSVPQAALARDMIRTMPEQREAAMGQAIEDVQKILDGEGDRQVIDVAGLEVFRKKVFVDDLLSDVGQGKPIPEGLSKENMEAERDRLDGVIEKVPSVKDALKLRQQLWERVSQDLADRGVISEEAAKNPTYVRHFVLDFIDEIRPAPGRTQRFKAPYRAYAKPRKGTLRDISTDYLEVELKALSTIYRDNAVQDMAERIAENYGVVKHEGEIPEGYVAWQFKRGNIVYRAKTIVDSQIAKILEGTLTDPEVADGLQIPLSALRDGLVLGGKRKTYIVPDWLALQLDDLPVTHKAGSMAATFTPVTQGWKRWILRVNPFRYNKRNAIGDAERVNAAGRTKAFLFVPQAAKMLTTHNSPDAHPDAYKKAVEYGALRSSLWHEMGKARNRGEFERFYRVKNLGAWKRAVRTAAWPGKIVSRAGQKIQDATQFREDILRAAVYLQALDDVDAFIATGKPIRHWVGAEKDIAALAKADKYRAAAKISRETLGDYGNFTPWENDKLRNGLMPFYSWLKINTTFWPRATIGAAREGARGRAVRTGAVAAVGLPLKGARVAWSLGKWSGLVLTPYALYIAYNNRDEEARKREASLPGWIRARPHLTLKEGVIYEPTALSDFTEWLGMDDDIADIRRWDRNQISGSELALSVMKNKARASVNKVVQTINPFLKTPATLLGMRTFPDVFDAKPFAQAFSTKAQERAVLEVLGADVQRFVDAGKGRRTLNEALAYYFSGSAYRGMSPDSLSERLRESLSRRTYKKTTIDRKTGAVRIMGAPHKGKGRDVDILRNRLRALEE